MSLPVTMSRRSICSSNASHCLATSKYCHSGNMHAFPASFGLKGEALSSTSDVSLFEIVIKTHGRPIGYRKVLKGKCLHFGIDDCRQDVGTIQQSMGIQKKYT